MKTELSMQSKADLEIFTPLLYSKINPKKSGEELAQIKSKTAEDTFNLINNQFCCDEKDGCFEKIKVAINHSYCRPKELNEPKKEILDVTHSDKNVSMKERYIENTFDTILYQRFKFKAY